MTNKNWDIDLSDGFYDHLEYRLSQFLGLKVLMVRGWKAPQICDYFNDGTTERFSSSDPEVQDLTRAVLEWTRKCAETPDPGPHPAEEAAADSLRAYLQGRDPDLANELYDEEITALAKNGHVTMRDSNIHPPHTVLIFDPQDNIKTRDNIIDDLFGAQTDNAWLFDAQNRSGLRPGAFVENFDIAVEKYRAAIALQCIRYALTNQDEFDRNRNGNIPFFYNFARLSNPRRKSLATAGNNLPGALASYSLSQAFSMRACPVDDTGMFNKLTQSEAAAHLIRHTGPAYNVFARLKDAYNGGVMSDITEESVKRYEQKLRTALREQVEASQPDAYLNPLMALKDPRVAIPAFREARNTLSFDRAGQVYLETIWKGVLRYFPTLAAQPMPVLKPGFEPPRTIAGYKPGQRPAGPRPQ